LNVALLDLQPQFAAIRADVLSANERVGASQHFIMGHEVADRATQDVPTLPIVPGLTAAQQTHVVSSIAEALR
jgi:hypothetical protein